MQKLRRENQRLTEELRKAEIVIDVQKKVARCWDGPCEGGPRGETLMTPSPIWPHGGRRCRLRFPWGGSRFLLSAASCLGPPASPAPEPALPAARPAPARALSPAERASVLTALHAERFQTAPRPPFRPPCWTKAIPLLDPHHVSHPRAGGRVPRAPRSVRSSALPEARVAGHRTQPTLSWDITKLLGPAKWTYFYLYVILDVFSRYVTGWMVAHREGAELAKQFIEETIGKHQVPAGQLNIHADRGRVMRSSRSPF